MNNYQLFFRFVVIFVIIFAWGCSDPVIEFPDGRKYTGEIKQVQTHQGVKKIPNGKGTMIWKNGDKYEGVFKNGQRDGQGAFTWKNDKKRKVYIGEYRLNKMQGEGTLTLINGSQYSGAFRNNVYNGQGTFTWPSGTKYAGEFRNGRREGKGKVSWSDGSKYVGDWRSDERTGQGKMVWVDGKTYEGNWREGEVRGHGTFTWPDGLKCTGSWPGKGRARDLPKNILQKLAVDKDWHIRKAAASNINISHELLNKLFADEHERVRNSARRTAARKTDSPPEVLIKLASDKERYVKLELANNIKAPIEALKMLIDRQDKKQDKTDISIRSNVASNPSAGTELLTRLAKDDTWKVRACVARNTSTPGEILIQLSDDIKWQVLLGVCNNPNASAEILKKLSSHSRWQIRRAIVLHANTSAETIKEFAKDDDNLIKEALKQRESEQKK